VIFPALREAVKSVMSGFGDRPVSLDLESKATAGGIAFDLVNVGWYARNGYPGIWSILSGGMPAWSGEPVSLETALNHSVVWACNRMICEPIGFMPLAMMQQKDAEKRIAFEHPMYTALTNAPNEDQTAMELREQETGHVTLQGNAFCKINRRSGTGVAIGLEPILPNWVIVDREKEGRRRQVYIVKDGHSPDKTYTVTPGKPHDILHVRGLGYDGSRGYSVLTMARQSFGTALATERNVARFFANGGRVPYLLEHPSRFKDDGAFEKFRADWEKTYSEPHRAPILEGGIKYSKIGLSAADSQLLETRQFGVPEICRWFLIPPHLVGDLSRANLGNVENLTLQFAKFTLTAWMTRWEQALWRCVLTPEEKTQGYYFRHNINGLLRGDFMSRMQGYSSALQNGHLSINEVRDLEDLNPIPGGDTHHIQVNMQSIGITDQNPARVPVNPTDEAPLF